MAISIQQLEDDWLSYKPAEKRALGGRRALSGFNYQLNIALNTFIDAVLKNDVDAAMAFDGLSDVGKLQNGLLYLTQVKTTLRTQSIKDAIDEFLAVDAFLEDRHRDLRRFVRYKIVCRATEGNINPDLSTLNLKLDPAGERRWKQLQKRVLRYSVEGDPTLELVIKLWDKVAKPFEFVSSLRGDLVQMLGDNEPSGDISQHLLQRWEQSKATLTPPGALLSPANFNTDSEGETRVLVGQRPTLRDISDGCFMERPDILQQIIDALRTASEKAEEKLSTRIPMIWINGGSGVGKSALLLQAMQRLVIETDAPINFLRHFAHELPDSIEFWSRQSIPVTIAVDDIYAPTYRKPELWWQINSLAYDAPYVSILTCGPPNYREAFEQQNQREGPFEVFEINVPALDQDERERYLEWYSVRTEQESVNPIQETNFVIAAFILERNRQGDVDIKEFTERLRQRLESLELIAEFCASVAANTLGLEAPMSMFDGKRDAVTQFLNDGLCQVEETPEQHESVRWFHPALAGSIYDFLVPPANTEARAVNLERYFASVIDTPEPAYAFIKLFTKGLIDEEVTRETLKKIWRMLYQRQPPDLRVGLMLVWKKTAKQCGLLPEKFIQKDRVKSWMDSPAMNAQGWGLLWQILWDLLTPDEQNALLPQTFSWLEQNRSLPEWSFVWQAIWKERPGGPELIQLARPWLIESAEVQVWSYIFLTLYNAEVREPWMLEAALEGLARTPLTVAERHLWPRIESLNAPLETLLFFVTKRLCKSHIIYISRSGIDFIASRVSATGTAPIIAAMSQEGDGPSWGIIIQLMFERWKEDSEIIAQLVVLGRNWLDGRQETPYWTYVWRRLVDTEPSEDLYEMGREWLREREHRPEWPFVWLRLVDAKPNDEALLRQGREWLGGQENRPEWGYIWRWLIDTHYDLKLVEQGREWLTGREDLAAWSRIWQRLVDDQPNDPDLLKQGLEWLKGREYQAEWTHTWRQLLDIKPKDEDLIERGRNWLNGRDHRPEWTYTWERLLDVQPRDEDLIERGREWLKRREDRVEWNKVWHRLITEIPDDEDLISLGLQWLTAGKERLNHPSWNYVWQDLVDIYPDDEDLISLGREWLPGRENLPEWNYIWQRLVDADPDDQALLRVGREWLIGREGNPGYFYVRRKLNRPKF